MQIVIKLSEKDYKSLNRYINFNLEYEDGRILSAVKQGVVLPENHGRLIDLDALCDEHLSGCYIELEEHEISEIPVIIEGTEGKG